METKAGRVEMSKVVGHNLSGNVPIHVPLRVEVLDPLLIFQKVCLSIISFPKESIFHIFEWILLRMNMLGLLYLLIGDDMVKEWF